MVPLVLGVLTGVLVGALMSRGTVCFNAGVRLASAGRDWRILRIFAIAVAVQFLLLPLLFALDVAPLVAAVDGSRPRLWPLAQVAGGLVFGGGMALAGGCIAGILWKTGAGSIATAVAILGFAAGELLARGAAAPAVTRVQEVAPPAVSSLNALIGVGFTPMALVLGAVLLAGLVAVSRAGLAFGVGLGTLGALAWVAADAAGYGYGLGFAGSAANLEAALSAGDLGAVSFEPYLALGVVLGGGLATRGPLRMPDAARTARALAGGGLMGFGATLAGACNIGHGLTGLPLLSLGSAVAITSMTIGAIGVQRLLRSRSRLRGTETPEPSW